MRILVCGGRNFSDRVLFKTTMEPLTATLIIHGMAEGADSLADEWGVARRIPVLRFPADWRKYGKAAGPLRNQEMLDEGRPDLVVAFPGGAGTADMVRRATEAGLKVMAL